MSSAPFDFRSYGHFEVGELQLGISLKKDGSDVLAALQFTNVSKRELHVTSRIWFQNLEVSLQGKPLRYMGPLVSMGPPRLSDFTTVKPGETYTDEPISLGTYFKLPENASGELKARYGSSGYGHAAEATLQL